MIYIPVTNIETAILVSEKIYNLTRPVIIKGASDITRYYCNWITHPTTNEVMLEMPEIAEIPIHLAAKDDELDDIFQPFVASGFITLDEVAAIKEAIQDNRGQVANIVQFVPTFWINQVKAREELELEGWFGNSDSL